VIPAPLSKAAPNTSTATGTKILGRVNENKSDKGGKYYTAAWKKENEQGLGIIVRLTMIGESMPREVKVMMTQAGNPSAASNKPADATVDLFESLKKIAVVALNQAAAEVGKATTLTRDLEVIIGELQKMGYRCISSIVTAQG
jgi:hypothetical protein